MPKNRPAIGDQNWGETLNAHLNQLSPNGGGLNSGTTAQRPILTADDEGYTFVDITTQELLKWSGNAWVVLLSGGSRGSLIVQPLGPISIVSGGGGTITSWGFPRSKFIRLDITNSNSVPEDYYTITVVDGDTGIEGPFVPNVTILKAENPNFSTIRITPTANVPVSGFLGNFQVQVIAELII